jgi:hypothetical protein
MAKVLIVKLPYQDELRRIPCTSVKTERGKLLAFEGENPVAEFLLDKIEHWSFEDSETARAVGRP